MLSLEECREILQAHVDEGNLNSEQQFALVDWYAEGEFCYAFTIQSRAYVETGDLDQMLVGGGHTLVNRLTGDLVFMANNGGMENYEKRGDPYNGLSNILHVAGPYKKGGRKDAFKHLRKVTGKSIVECRDIIDNMIEGRVLTFQAKYWGEVAVQNKIVEFQNLGFSVKRLTTFEVRDTRLNTSQSRTGI